MNYVWYISILLEFHMVWSRACNNMIEEWKGMAIHYCRRLWWFYSPHTKAGLKLVHGEPEAPRSGEHIQPLSTLAERTNRWHSFLVEMSCLKARGKEICLGIGILCIQERPFWFDDIIEISPLGPKKAQLYNVSLKEWRKSRLENLLRHVTGKMRLTL